MATDPRWTPETAAALRRELGLFLIQEGALHRFEDFAEHILDALAGLGVLAVPADLTAARQDGWARAVACLEGVVKRTGSISAKYWAEYLRTDPDKERDREVPDA